MIQKPNKGVSPLYSLVKNGILNSIRSGTYHVGDKLPSETDLCAEYQVSRTTIRYAMQQLELEGIVHRIQGKGTFVSKPKPTHSFSKSFQEEVSSQGLQANNLILKFTIIPANRLLKEMLQISEQDPVIQLIRLRMANEDPLQYITSFIPWKLAPGLKPEDCKHSLFQILKERYNIQIRQSTESIESVLADEIVSKNLQIPIGSPILYLESIAYDDSGKPIEYSEGYVRSKLVIHNQIHPSNSNV
jgi:GntR family transcriptional regulator